MKKLNVAVIGAGIWGMNHVRVYKELDSFNLVAICDINKEKVKAIAEKNNAKPYTDSSLMFKSEKIDAVSVCTWSTVLAKQALLALKSGMHVLVEKPMAASVREAEVLLDAAESSGLILTVGFLMRFILGLQRIRENIQNKLVGDLVSASAKRVSQWPERIGDVGVVKDISIHDIDVMRYISNEDPVSVYAKTGSRNYRKFEDFAQIMLTYESGKSAFIESNWLTPYKTRTLSVTGSDAIMRLDYLTQELWIENAKESVQPRLPISEPLKQELQHFSDCILNKKTPITTGLDGIKALQIATAALKSSKENRVIKLK